MSEHDRLRVRIGDLVRNRYALERQAIAALDELERERR